MCPACMASMALVAGSVSTGGIAALAVRMRRLTKSETQNNPSVTERRNDDGDKRGDENDR